MSKDRVYGFSVIETLSREAPQQIVQVYIDNNRVDRRAQKLKSRLDQIGLTWQEVTTQKIDELAAGGHHQGVVALVVNKPILDENGVLELVGDRANPVLCVLESVQDPHNLGACLRTAEAANVDAVVMPRHDSCGITPAVRHAAAGAAELIPIARVANLARLLNRLQKEADIWLVGTDSSARTSLYDISLVGPIALIFGSEGTGLKRLTLERCDHVVTIPMTGRVGSLNVSVAVGIGLFEAVRQRISRLGKEGE
ncbi:MAG: 23S rRNA (guanosine(2251)-2'-O)-methyltransferase RlmB [Arenicellales bacterium]|nr:23S rRNA (guanosine(2251)-2'-O)-methyltransferase RlmB [Arenicellales bacterium]